MLFIESFNTDPYYNLALEDHMFSGPGQTQDIFMLWRNDRSVIIGKYQNAAAEVRMEYADSQGIRIARRLSGGGAVYHDLGNLNYTFITDSGDGRAFDFARLSKPVISALARLGIQAEASGRNDLTISGRKFCGNAQYVRGGRVCHHGCILVSTDPANVVEALRVDPAKFSTHATKSVRSRVITIDEAAGRVIGAETFAKVLYEEVDRRNGCVPFVLREEDLTAIHTLRNDKYASREWIWGAAPDYGMERTKKFPSGLVTVRLSVSAGMIKGIRIFGDFFGDREIADLEKALTGAAVDSHLADRLASFPMDEYMRGISAEKLCDMLR